VALAVVSLAGCAPSATIDPAATDEGYAHVRSALAAYDSAGFLTGAPNFPVVGRWVVLSGPGDSVFVGFAASMPASALRFARDGSTVAARYQVTMLVRAGADTLARVDRREVVRVADLAEASSREPRVLFQRFVLVPAGSMTLDVTVRELTARKQAERSFRFDARRGVSQPLVAYRAEGRTSLAEPPEALLNARNTVTASDGSVFVLVEGVENGPGPARLRVDRGGAELWSDTLPLASGREGPPSAVVALPVHLLPPGRATLRTEDSDGGTASAAPLYIGLSLEWVFPSWEESVAHLVYALDPDTLERWSVAPPEEHGASWRRFQEATDPDPATPANEFLARYFDRMGLANDRFDEPGRAGWETNRGEVLVKLGEPTRQRFIRPERQNEVPRIEWEYDESLPAPALIVFEDASDFGVFVMTSRSRAVLRRLVRDLAERG
jgi:GWxTD domain-containing protein